MPRKVHFLLGPILWLLLTKWYDFDADCSQYTLMHIPDHNVAVTLLNNEVNSLDIQIRNETVKIKRDF